MTQVQTLSPVKTVEAHTSSVNGVSIFEGKAYSCSSDSTIKVWSLDSDFDLVAEIKGHESRVTGMRFPTGVLTGEELPTPQMPLHQELYSPRFSTSEYIPPATDTKTYFITSSHDNTIKSWSTVDYRLLRTYRGHQKRVTTTILVEERRKIISGSADFDIRLWDLFSGNTNHIFKGHTDQITSIKYTHGFGAPTLYSASVDKTVRLWDPVLGHLRETLTGHPSWIFGLEVDPRTGLLASSDKSGTVMLWDVRSHSPRTSFSKVAVLPSTYITQPSKRNVSQFKAHSLSVLRVAFDPSNSNYLYTASWDGNIHQFDLRKFKKEATPSCVYAGHKDRITSFSFIDKGYIISGSKDNRINIWNKKNGTLLYTLKGHTSTVNSIQRDPDTGLIISGSDDNTIRLWEVPGIFTKKQEEGKKEFSPFYSLEGVRPGLQKAIKSENMSTNSRNLSHLRARLENLRFHFEQFAKDARKLSSYGRDTCKELSDLSGNMLKLLEIPTIGTFKNYFMLNAPPMHYFHSVSEASVTTIQICSGALSLKATEDMEYYLDLESHLIEPVEDIVERIKSLQSRASKLWSLFSKIKKDQAMIEKSMKKKTSVDLSALQQDLVDRQNKFIKQFDELVERYTQFVRCSIQGRFVDSLEEAFRKLTFHRSSVYSAVREVEFKIATLSSLMSLDYILHTDNMSLGEKLGSETELKKDISVPKDRHVGKWGSLVLDVVMTDEYTKEKVFVNLGERVKILKKTEDKFLIQHRGSSGWVDQGLVYIDEIDVIPRWYKGGKAQSGGTQHRKKRRLFGLKSVSGIESESELSTSEVERKLQDMMNKLRMKKHGLETARKYIQKAKGIEVEVKNSDDIADGKILTDYVSSDNGISGSENLFDEFSERGRSGILNTIQNVQTATSSADSNNSETTSDVPSGEELKLSERTVVTSRGNSQGEDEQEE